MSSFSRIVGHRRLTTLLSGAVARETLPQTLLLVGPAGVGKYLVGRAVASTLNCLSPTRDPHHFPIDACGQCRACDRVARGLHVDVLTLEPDDRGLIRIDVVRDALERTGYRPFEGRRRVVLIRDAHGLDVAAQNACLKALEEPPPSTVFVLTTSVPAQLLPTVRSRCMRLAFGRLTEQDVQAVLTRDHDITADDARSLAALADGSVGQALSLGSTDWMVLRETALRLLQQTAPAPPVAARLQTGGLLSATPSRKERTREELGMVLRLAASMLRDIALIDGGGDRQLLAHPALDGELGALTRSFGGGRGREAFECLDRALAALDRNAGTKVVSEWVAVGI